jgi:hypothetical protein
MRGQRIAGGLVILLIGAMFLLANMGVMDMSVWTLVFRFWPVLLIIGGVTLLLGGGFSWFLVPLLILAIVAGTFGGPLIWGWSTGQLTTEVFTPAEAVELTSLEFDVRMDAPSLRVLAPVPQAYRLEVGYRASADPVVDFDLTGTSGRLSLRQTSTSRVYVFGAMGSRQNLAFGFAAGIPLDLRFALGATNADLDLRPYLVRGLDLDVGAGNVQLYLGQPQGTMTVTVETGAGNIEVRVPNGVGVRLVPNVGIGAKDFGSAGLVQSGNVWQDDLYATAADRIDIRLSAGVGRVVLTRY